ncbi:unnamed protein product [Clonostachys rosea]|uniref:FAD-binding domain-containing protein n=1 Tax=Bionectria ochroleuca TaxID=29856 RepID=A0ABY6UGY3_BIOOC|nr:unnamed protein product [Clonostachys rosea]
MPGLLQTGEYNGNSPSTDLHSIDVPVLIVGAGPVGLLTAYMLSRYGVKSLLIEKYAERLAAPKAHALCPRSIEICRQFRLDTNAMRDLGSPRQDAFWVNFVTNLSGERIGTLPYERMDAAVLDVTPEMIHNIPQPDFENLVASKLRNDENVDIRKNVSFTGDEVTTIIEDRSSSTSLQVRSRHVIACDGARSQVRKHLGIESEGEDGYETMMTIHFKADLRAVVGDRVGMLHWITDPACSGFIIAYDLGGNHVLISNFDSEKHPAERWSDDLARSTVCAAIGQDIPFDILSYRPWILSGLGLNSGLADAHNIAYKVAAVHQNWANPSLIDSYHTDRRPIALVNSSQSVKNGKKIFTFLKTLGTAGINNVEDARANLHKSIHDPAKQEMIAAEIEGQREHFDNLGIHIGYVYDGSTKIGNASDFTPKFVAGARLPHAWIRPRTTEAVHGLSPVDVSYVQEFSAAEVQLMRYSTLDLVGYAGFTLIVARQEEWARRFEAAKNLLGPLNVVLELRSLDGDFDFVYDTQRKIFLDEGHLSLGSALLLFIIKA